MNTTRNFEILNGPSKDTLFDACKYAYSETAKVPVAFAIAAGLTAPRESGKSAFVPTGLFDTRVTSIEHEDGSGESLNVRGVCLANIKPFGKAEDAKWYDFVAYFNTKTRKGNITLTEK